MGTLKSVSPPQHSNRSTILKVSPMVTEVTFAPLHKHNTCTVLKLLFLPVMTKTAFFFLCNAVSIACFWPLILWQERNWSTFSIDSRRAWAFFFHDFFFSLFAGLLDSAAALDTGTFFCCFASMEFRMLMLVFLVKFPDRNGGKNIF